MTYEHEGKCRRCNIDCGTLDGKRVHTISGLLYCKATYKDGKVRCDSAVFPFEPMEKQPKESE